MTEPARSHGPFDHASEIRGGSTTLFVGANVIAPTADTDAASPGPPDGAWRARVQRS
jgi:hypothetical protein